MTIKYSEINKINFKTTVIESVSNSVSDNRVCLRYASKQEIRRAGLIN